MGQWVCIVCSWVYDPAKGDPDSGIAPGTAWEEIPDDWSCPICGVGKDDFEWVPSPELTDDIAADDVVAPVVILGTGLAGYGVAKEFRKHDSETPLVIITADDGRAYSKPMLSTGYTKNVTADDLVQADASAMAVQLNATIQTMTKVIAIDTDHQTLSINHVVSHHTETSLHYSKLVMAMGANTIVPPIKGDALDELHSINDLLDYASFQQVAKQRNAKKICIIGGGLIGCEYTNDLLNGGFEIETIDPLAYCLPTLLPEVAGTAVQRALEEKGAKFHFGLSVTEVNKTDNGVVVSLNNGDTINADMVICAVGVRPRIELAVESGIEVNRGIITNRLLETSANNVYALGDCAEVAGNVLVYVAPLMACARALGKTLTGEPTIVSYPAMPITIKTPACPVVVSPVAKDVEGEWTVEVDGNNVIAKFHDPEGNLIGFALTGEGTKQRMQLQKQLPAIMV
jgi:rubredoxin-NAD+ reductase